MFKLNKYHVFLYLPHGFVAVSYILPFYTTIARSMIGKPEVQWMLYPVWISLLFSVQHVDFHIFKMADPSSRTP
jgi:uncharacterized membrane protein